MVQGDEVELAVVERLPEKGFHALRLPEQVVVIAGDHPHVTDVLPGHPFPDRFQRLRIDVEKVQPALERGLENPELRLAARSDRERAKLPGERQGRRQGSDDSRQMFSDVGFVVAVP